MLNYPSDLVCKLQGKKAIQENLQIKKDFRRPLNLLQCMTLIGSEFKQQMTKKQNS